MADNSAAGSQPGPLPTIHRIIPTNSGVQRFETERPGLPDRIIYHSTVSPNTTGSSAAWLATNPGSGVSIHTLANRDGSLTEICPPLYKAYHAGYCLPGWSNATALGIEIENASGDAEGIVEQYPPAQVGAAAYRVATWAYSFGIPPERIKAHKDVAVFGPTDPRAGQLGRKQDPVGPFPDERFRALVQAWLTFFAALPESEHALYIEGRVPPPAPKVYGFLGPSTISPAVAERVMRAKHSPIIEERPVQEYIDACDAAGINFAVALAFCYHENQLGTSGVTAPLKNWGAVRTAERLSLALPNRVWTPVGYFAAYPSWLNSLVDWCARIRGPKYLGSNPTWSVAEALQVYSPTSDGNVPAAYNAAVQTLCRAWEQESAG